MEGKRYVTKGYSTNTNIPAQRGGYDHEPKPQLNQYAVETPAIGRVRAPAAGYTNWGGSPSKAELLREYGDSPPVLLSPKYAQKNHHEGHEPKYGTNYENSSPPISPIKHLFSSPNRGYFSEGSNQLGSGLGLTGSRNVKNGGISALNKDAKTAGSPATHHPLTTSTNNINKPLGLSEESVYYSPRADPRRRGEWDLDKLSTRAQPRDAKDRYARPAFMAKPNATRHQYREVY